MAKKRKAGESRARISPSVTRRFLASIVESSDDAVIGKALDGTIVSWNPGAEKIYEYTEAEAKGRNISIIVPPEKRQELTEIIELVAIGQDIQERKQAETALLDSESRLGAIVATAVDGIITIDERGIIQTFNPAAERLFGYKAEEVSGRNVSFLMPEPDRRRHDQYIQNYLHTGEAKIIGIGREVEGRRKDGTLFPIRLGVAEMQVGAERMFTGIVHDLTEFKRMQEETLQARSLAALGEMAATVAHQIKTPIATISGVIQLLSDEVSEDDPRRDMLRELQDRVRRLNETVKHLLTLSRPWKPDSQPFDLREVVEYIVDSLKREEAFRKVDFAFNGTSELSAPVDLMYFEEAVRNLLHNAAHAMPAGGKIYLGFAETNGQACVKIKDTGTGIPAEVLHKLFQPFFTTKPQGTGLGLFICKRVVEAHGGSISVTSEPEAGTEVTLQFPTE